MQIGTKKPETRKASFYYSTKLPTRGESVRYRLYETLN